MNKRTKIVLELAGDGDIIQEVDFVFPIGTVVFFTDTQVKKFQLPADALTVVAHYYHAGSNLFEVEVDNS